jgi:hypothetical protein
MDKETPLDTDTNTDFIGDEEDSELGMWLEMRISFEDLSERGKKEVEEWERTQKNER